MIISVSSTNASNFPIKVVSPSGTPSTIWQPWCEKALFQINKLSAWDQWTIICYRNKIFFSIMHGLTLSTLQLRVEWDNGLLLKCTFRQKIFFWYVKEIHFSNLLHQHSEKRVTYTVRPRKKQNPETKGCCDQVPGCMTIIIYISWIMFNMLSNDT